MDIRKLPIGIQDFEYIRKNNFVYADKTAYISSLARNGKVYFLFRPRRFGKSLLISTFHAYFEGKKNLFSGLAAEKIEAQYPDAWTAYPVFEFNFTGKDYSTSDALFKTLDYHLGQWESIYGSEFKQEPVELRFRHLIETACKKTGHGVVVLTDEYDKPLLETINAPELHEKNRALLKGFFGVLKATDQWLRFAFFTGVTKFSHVSIFSDLNQLRDISMTEAFCAICGITQNELEKNFTPEISALAGQQHLTHGECLAELRRMYDGYHFYPDTEGLYNPFSLLNAFANRDFQAYWFATGTPTFLVRQLEKADYDIRDFTEGVEATAQILSDYRIDNPDPVPLFYQSGYLTIKDYDRELRIFTLTYPNDEVKYGFLNFLTPFYTGLQETKQTLYIGQFVRDIRAGKLDSVMERFQTVYAGLPYSSGKPPERDFQIVIYLVFTLLGQFVKNEVHSSKGRADCILETKDAVYIFEFKVDAGADDALRQIEEKGYAEPFKADPHKIIKIGVSFSSEKRNIAEWKTNI